MARLAGVHLSLLAHILQTVLPSLIHRSYSRTSTRVMLMLHRLLGALASRVGSSTVRGPCFLFSFDQYTYIALKKRKEIYEALLVF